MPIFDIFSKRQKALRGDIPDVYRYDDIPTQLKTQIIYIIEDVLGNRQQYENYSSVRDAYNFIANTLRREYGVFHLRGSYGERSDEMANLMDFFLNEKNIEKILDVIELSFRVVDRVTRRYDYLNKQNASKDADLAIEELNIRFKEHGVGYYFTSGQIVRIDSELIHAEVVRPALKILSQSRYAGAQQEFLTAHEHYRGGKTKEALNECLKSLESVMKSICDKRGWSYGDGDAAHALIKICFDNGLIPPFWRAQFSALRSLLESGVPTARNRLGSHGQGAAPKPVPDHIAGYVLHMTAAAIVFLAEAEASDAG